MRVSLLWGFLWGLNWVSIWSLLGLLWGLFGCKLYYDNKLVQEFKPKEMCVRECVDVFRLCRFFVRRPRDIFMSGLDPEEVLAPLWTMLMAIYEALTRPQVGVGHTN